MSVNSVPFSPTEMVQTSQPGMKREDPGYDPGDPRALPDEWIEPVAFDIFDDEGRFLGPVTTPEGFRTYPELVFNREWALPQCGTPTTCRLW